MDSMDLARHQSAWGMSMECCTDGRDWMPLVGHIQAASLPQTNIATCRVPQLRFTQQNKNGAGTSGGGIVWHGWTWLIRDGGSSKVTSMFCLFRKHCRHNDDADSGIGKQKRTTNMKYHQSTTTRSLH
jgi:hypothetical protein